MQETLLVMTALVGLMPPAVAREATVLAEVEPALKPVESSVARIGSSDVNGSALAQGDPVLRLKDGFIGKVL